MGIKSEHLFAAGFAVIIFLLGVLLGEAHQQEIQKAEFREYRAVVALETGCDIQKAPQNEMGINWLVDCLNERGDGGAV